jgi:hypothetical protein
MNFMYRFIHVSGCCFSYVSKLPLRAAGREVQGIESRSPAASLRALQPQTFVNATTVETL